ncbi:MAG: hypothetical protein QOF76_224 [Solirubrobacteraceae bacterium]|jgi:hypothetical protein|nr:hypothetical protein [Solirubrobacteraceae bacterium]
MATWDDVRRLALALPETEETTRWRTPCWDVAGNRGFVWDRPLSKKDLKDMGDAAPDGPILGVGVEHEGAKRALLQSDPAVFFTIPHFDGYPAVLVRLDEIRLDDLEEVIVEAWLCHAPERLAKAYIAEHGGE